MADSRGAGKKTSAGKQAGQGSSTGRSGQKSSRRAQGGRPQRTRDREAEATIREMREGDVNRRQTVSRQKQRRLKQMRSRLTVLSACIVIAVTCGAFFGAVDAGWLEGGETAKRLVRERGIFAGWSAGNGGAGENIENGDGSGEETNAENAAESASNQAEDAAAFAEKAGKMKGVLATVKIKADNPEDVDGDGIANHQDIFESAMEYIATEPVYEDRYYQTGYPDDGYGVCTDVVGFAFLGAGFDLQMLVKSDIEEHFEDYSEMEKPDPKIDFRRVKNLDVFFQHTAEVLTTDLSDPDQWLPGDIVTWERHIGIISDRKNERGIPYVIHHAGKSQTEYVEDILEGNSRYTYVREITGHYRVS